jgi:hypothetical protein
MQQRRRSTFFGSKKPLLEQEAGTSSPSSALSDMPQADTVSVVLPAPGSYVELKDMPTTPSAEPGTGAATAAEQLSPQTPVPELIVPDSKAISPLAEDEEDDELDRIDEDKFQETFQYLMDS